jgi:guanylate kinase
MLIFVAGKGGTGKDTVCEKVFSRLIWDGVGIQRIIPCTTRKMREGESSGVEYQFMTEDDFQSRKMLEKRSYNKLTGTVWYGTPYPYEPRGVYMTWGSCDQWVEIEKNTKCISYCIFLESSVEDRLKRMLKRANKNPDEILEACRRLYKDEDDYNKIIDSFNPDYTIYNDNGYYEVTIENMYLLIKQIIDVHREDCKSPLKLTLDSVV